MFAIFPILQTWNFLRTEIICDFLFCLSHYKEKGQRMRKFIFAIIQPRKKRIQSHTTKISTSTVFCILMFTWELAFCSNCTTSICMFPNAISMGDRSNWNKHEITWAAVTSGCERYRVDCHYRVDCRRRYTLSMMVVSASCFSKRFTTFACPFSTAQWSGVIFSCSENVRNWNGYKNWFNSFKLGEMP